LPTPALKALGYFRLSANADVSIVFAEPFNLPDDGHERRTSPALMLAIVLGSLRCPLATLTLILEREGAADMFSNVITMIAPVFTSICGLRVQGATRKYSEADEQSETQSEKNASLHSCSFPLTDIRTG